MNERNRATIRSEQMWLISGSLALLAFLAACVLLMRTAGIMIPFVLAVFVVSLSSPVVDVLVLRLKLPHWIAVSLTLVLVLAMIAVFCLLMYNATNVIVSQAYNYCQEAGLTLEKIEGFGKSPWLVERKMDFDWQDIMNDVPYYVVETAGTALNLVSTSVMVGIFSAFLLAGRDPRAFRSGVYAEVDNKIRRYISAKVILSVATGVLVWGILHMLGLKLAGIFAILAFLLNFIPTLGSIIATLLPIPIAVGQYGGDLWMVGAVIVLPGLVQTVIGNIIEPRMMGRELELHPVAVLLALSFWGLLWGIVGMVLAVPLTALLRIILLKFEIVRPLGKLLSGEMPGAPPKVQAVPLPGGGLLRRGRINRKFQPGRRRTFAGSSRSARK